MATAVQATLAVWAAFELVLRVVETAQRRGHTGGDRGTRTLIALALAAALAGGAFLEARVGSAPWRLPPVVTSVGVAVMAVGLALRAWSVLTLGRSFRTTVETSPDQTVVERGPYRVVRHPSYAGLLLIVLGFEVSTRVWPAVALTLLPLAAVVRRIDVEERHLLTALGPAYASYRARTRRLVPGVW
jgi:protein-S-isoprenylcysteine O-methyltransferase Ste14